MENPNILFIHGTLSSYNDPIYKMLNEVVNITHAYIDNNEVANPVYQTFLFPHWRFGPFVIHRKLHKIINKYDIVIINAHLRSIRLALLPFFPHKPKLISWSIGVHVSYRKKFNLEKAPDFADRLFQFIQNHCDACIFYMPQPIEYWKKHSKIDERKFFVAHNTVKVADFKTLPSIKERNKYLFVGTLYQQKGLGELLEAYYMAKKINVNLPCLYIIGKGPEENLIKSIIIEKGLDDSVVMTGAIYDEDVLKDFFLTSLLCISPKQAGLSVQKSLGYGTPFVTRPDAITGGERLDIHDKINGFFYRTKNELVDILIEAFECPMIIERMSIAARNYYLKEASPERMVEGAMAAIKYVSADL